MAGTCPPRASYDITRPPEVPTSASRPSCSSPGGGMSELINLAILATVLGLAPLATAQAASGDGRLTYDAVFFEPYSPANALQMVERLPGFTLESGDSSVRGFGQAAGNVVVNGQRPSSKSDAVSVVLSRIPASRVLRIELAPGVTFGADFAGKPQVANVILTEAGGLAGTLEARLVREFTGSILPNASASVLLQRGASSFTASAKLQNFAYSEDGIDELTVLPGGAPLERRDIFRDSREPYRIFSIGWAHEADEDRSSHINAKVSIDPWNIDQVSRCCQSKRTSGKMGRSG